MSDVAIQRVKDSAQSNLPIFKEIAEKFREIRQRAWELFETRGRELGHDLENWLRAEREVLGPWPAAELKESNGKYELEMMLPGYEPKEVQVTATPKEIIVHAETKHEKKAAQENILWTEYKSSDVHRGVELPEAIEVDKTNASLEKGMLRIVAAKAVVAKPRAIDVAA